MTVRLLVDDEGSPKFEKAAAAEAKLEGGAKSAATALRGLEGGLSATASAADREAAATARAAAATKAAGLEVEHIQTRNASSARALIELWGVRAPVAIDAVSPALHSVGLSTDKLHDSTLRLTTATDRQGQVAQSAARGHVLFWSEIDRASEASSRAIGVQQKHSAVLDHANGLWGKFTGGVRGARESLSDLDPILQTDVSRLTTLASVFGAVGLAAGVYVVKRGLQQNAIMEQSRLGMAALVSSLGEITDANGHVLQGQERWNASLVISEQLQHRLVKAFAEVTGSYKDGVLLMQQGLGPLIQAGVTKPEDIVNFIKNVAQTATTLGVPGDRIGQEIRALIAGEKGPDNQVANALLGDLNKEKIDQLKKAGEYIGVLTERMSAYGRAGQETSKTMAGAWSNLQDAIDQALGAALADATSPTSRAINELTASIVTFDEKGQQVFNPQFIAGVHSLGDALVFVAESGVYLVQHTPDIMEALERFRQHPLGAGGPRSLSPSGPASDADAQWRDAQARLAADRAARRAGFEVLTGAKPADINPIDIALEPGRQRRLDLPFATTAMPNKVEEEAGYFAQQHGFDNSKNSVFAVRAREYFKGLIEIYTEDRKLTIEELRQAEAAFEEDAAKLVGGNTASGGPKIEPKKNPADPLKKGLQNRIDGVKEEWSRLFDSWGREAAAQGDPLRETFAKIEDQRKQKLDALSTQQREFGAVMGADFFKDKRAEINRHFVDLQQQAGIAVEISRFANAYTGEADRKLSADRDEHAKRAKDIALRTARELEDQRLELIHDSIDRELAERLAANAREFADAQRTYRSDTDEYKASVDRKKKLDDAAFQNAERRRDEERRATSAWARTVQQDVTGSMGTTASNIATSFIQSRQALTSEFDSFFADVIDGNADLVKSFEDLSKSLGKTWSHNLSLMLSNGQPVMQQLKDMVAHINAMGDSNPLLASKDYSFIDAALSGAGIGSIVGGAFGGPKNHAQEGGAFGGMLGALVGSIVPGLGTALGAAFGSAYGTVIGAAIQKGTDSIKVTLHDVLLSNLGYGPAGRTERENGTRLDLGGGAYIDVDEKGISAATRADLVTQIRRKTREVMHSWQDVIDMLPEDLRAKLADMKLASPTLSLTGGVEAGDLRDESALQSLEDFLGDKLPRAAFSSYKASIQAAMRLLGGQAPEIEAMFARWGELQGQELHDAVKKYFEVIIDTRNLIGGLSTPIDVRRAAAAAELGKPMLGNLHAITDEMGLAFASMSKLTDVDDKIAAQEHLNELGRQYYKESADMLVNLLGMEKQFNAQDQSMLEQLDLTGLGDDKQAKLDFYYKHLTDARHDMLSATDPKVIAEIQQRANGYIQAAMGVAPDSKANLEQLRHIIGDLADIRNGKIESSIETEIAKEDQKAATMLQDAAKLLQGAANALNPGGETPAPGPDPQPGDDEPKLPKPIEQPLAGADSLLGSSSELHASSVALAEVTGNLRHLGEWASGGDDGPPGRTHLEEIRRALQMSEGARSRDVGDAVRTALEGLELTGTMVTQLDVDTGGLVDVAARAAEQRVVLRLKRNRDGLTSRIDGGR